MITDTYMCEIFVTLHEKVVMFSDYFYEQEKILTFDFFPASFMKKKAFLNMQHRPIKI